MNVFLLTLDLSELILDFQGESFIRPLILLCFCSWCLSPSLVCPDLACAVPWMGGAQEVEGYELKNLAMALRQQDTALEFCCVIFLLSFFFLSLLCILRLCAYS